MFLRLLNAIFPQKKTANRLSALEYSGAEYNWAKTDFTKHLDVLNLTGMTVLDAGCGLGGRTVFYSEYNPTVIYGIDMDPKHIEYSREFAKSKGKESINFQQANLTSLPFVDNYFDVIILNDVMEHIRRDFLRGAIEELSRVLKKGGKLFVEFPPWSSPYAAHLYDHIAIPWCHFLFKESDLIEFVIAKGPTPRFGELSYLEHFNELNRLEKDEFYNIVSAVGLKPIYSSDRIIRRFRWLSGVPFLKRFITLRVITILTKDE